MIRTWNILQLLSQWIYCIVNGKAFAWILMVLIDHSLSCQFRHTHYTVRIIHTVFLY